MKFYCIYIYWLPAGTEFISQVDLIWAGLGPAPYGNLGEAFENLKRILHLNELEWCVMNAPLLAADSNCAWELSQMAIKAERAYERRSGTRQGVLRKHIAYQFDTCGGREM